MAAAGIARVRGVRRLGLRVGKWATAEEATALLQAPDASTAKGKRDRAILARCRAAPKLGTSLRVALEPGKMLGFSRVQVQVADMPGAANSVRCRPLHARMASKPRKELAAIGAGFNYHGSQFNCSCRWRLNCDKSLKLLERVFRGLAAGRQLQKS
jgi:hypothetical protein